jgi:hypothetical protein
MDSQQIIFGLFFRYLSSGHEGVTRIRKKNFSATMKGLHLAGLPAMILVFLLWF